jgi:high-affinity nickel-transport protein
MQKKGSMGRYWFQYRSNGINIAFTNICNWQTNGIAFWGGMIGAIALATIGAINIYSIKRWGRTGSAILATRVVTRTNFLGPVGSASVTGLVFGVGFDTATQISALTLSAIASATLGVQIALMLAVFLSWV